MSGKKSKRPKPSHKEGQVRDKRIEEQRQLRELVRREQRDEYDQVLHPLMRAQRLNEHVEERFWLFENAALGCENNLRD